MHLLLLPLIFGRIPRSDGASVFWEVSLVDWAVCSSRT